MVKCPMKGNKNCTDFPDYPSKSNPSNKVFYIHDSKVEEQDKLMQTFLKQNLREWNYELVSFNTTYDATRMAFCNNICRQILESAFVIADVTGTTSESDDEIRLNSNVSHEIGLSQGFQKEILLVTRKDVGRDNKKLPFNLRGFGIFHVNRNPGDIDKILKNIKNNLKEKESLKHGQIKLPDRVQLMIEDLISEGIFSNATESISDAITRLYEELTVSESEVVLRIKFTRGDFKDLQRLKQLEGGSEELWVERLVNLYTIQHVKMLMDEEHQWEKIFEKKILLERRTQGPFMYR